MTTNNAFTAALLIISLALPGISNAALPDPGMQVEKGRTALVVTDPQNDFLSPKGVTWGVVGKSVTANHTVENIVTRANIAEADFQCLVKAASGLQRAEC